MLLLLFLKWLTKESLCFYRTREENAVSHERTSFCFDDDDSLEKTYNTRQRSKHIQDTQHNLKQNGLLCQQKVQVSVLSSRKILVNKE